MKFALSGALALLVSLLPAMRAAAGSDGAILMPPFLVEEQKGDGIEWIYGNGDGIRVLSGCGTDATAGFVRQIMEQRGELLKFIPDEFLLHEGLPETLIIFPKSEKQAMDQALEREFREGAVASSRQFTPMNDLRLSDPDSSDIFIVFDDTLAKTDVWVRDGGRTQSINYPTPVRSPSYVRFLLQARAPALPDWYVNGCARLYETMDFKPAADPGGLAPEPVRSLVEGVSFGPDPWLSDSDASALSRHPYGARPLVPMRELFGARYPFAKSDLYRRVWEAQAELFVRWALSGRIDGGQERLRRFVEGATTERTTEAFFYSCFGIDYADALDALSDYLPRAAGQSLFVPSSTALRLPPVEFRTATAGEVRRIRSEWSRRVLGAIKEDNPGAFSLFAEKVRDSFERAFAQGERDPDFLASLALFRIQYGRPTEGLRLLEQFPGAAATRPVARLELAQQHLLEALERPAGAGGTLSGEQAAELMGEISLSLRPGPIESAYRLAAKVCEHLGLDPTPSERGILADGARQFPRNSELVVQAAALELRAGEDKDAAKLIELGLWENGDPSARKSLVVLDNLAREALTVASPQTRNH
jgi:hypothetical protein